MLFSVFQISTIRLGHRMFSSSCVHSTNTKIFSTFAEVRFRWMNDSYTRDRCLRIEPMSLGTMLLSVAFSETITTRYEFNLR